MATTLNLDTPSKLPGIRPLVATPPAAMTIPEQGGALPSLAPTLRPIVTSPREQRIQFLQQQIQKEQQPGPAKPGFWHRLGRIASGIGNVAGDVLDPAAMEMIPGTQLHNRLELNHNTRELAGLQAMDDTEQNDAAKRSLEGEQAAQSVAAAKSDVANAAAAGARAHLANSQATLYDDALGSMKDPAIQKAFGVLSDPNASIGERRAAMATISESPLSMTSLGRGALSGAENLYRRGEMGAQVGGHNIVPDANSPTGYSTVQYNRFGIPMGTIPVEPSSEPQLLLGPQGDSLIGAESNLAGSRAAQTQSQRLVPIISPQSNQVIGYAPMGEVASATGAGPSGMISAMSGGLTYKPGTTVIEQAQNADSLRHMIIDNIRPAIVNAARAGEIGPESGRVQDLLRHIGDPGSPAAKLWGTLEAVPMMLGRMYGYRSAEYAQAMNKLMSTRLTPEALNAYMNGILEHASTIEETGGVREEGGSEPSGRAPSSTAHYAMTASGPNGVKIGSNDGGKTWYNLSTGKEYK